MSKGIKHKDIGFELTYDEYHMDGSHELNSGATFPSSPSEKELFYRTDEHRWYIFNGADWKPLIDVEVVSSLPTPILGRIVLLTTDGHPYIAV